MEPTVPAHNGWYWTASLPEVPPSLPTTASRSLAIPAGVFLILSWAVISLFSLCLAYHFWSFFTRIKPIIKRYTRETARENENGYTRQKNRISKGYPFCTWLCLQSVVCYTLCRRCCENEVATGEGKHIWSSRKTGLWWRGAASTGLVSSADRAYMEAVLPRPTLDLGTKCPELVNTLTKKLTVFSVKIEIGGKQV